MNMELLEGIKSKEKTSQEEKHEDYILGAG